MASNQVGEAVIRLKMDGSGVGAELKNVSSKAQQSGTSVGGKFSNAFNVAMGNLLSKGISTGISAVSSSIGTAIKRVDTLNQFPKVMTALGYSADEAQGSIDKMKGALDGLPTLLQDQVSWTQRLAATMGNLDRGTVNATSVGLAFNNMMLAGGKGTETANEAFSQYNRMLATGKVNQLNWNAVVNAAPGQVRQLAQSLLGAEAGSRDLYEAMQAGTISFDDFNEAMVRLNEEGGEGFSSFADQAREGTKGLETSIGLIRTRFTNAMGEIIKSLDTEKIAEFIDTTTKGFGAIAQFIIKNIMPAVNDLANFIMDNSNWLFPTVLISGLVAVILFGLTQVYTYFTASLIPMLSTFFGFIMANPIVLVIAGIIGAIIFLATHLEFVKEVARTVCEAIGGFFSGLWDGIVNIFNGVVGFFRGVFQGAWNAIKSIFSGAAKWFQGVFNGIVGVFKSVGATIGNAVGGAFRAVINGVIGFAENFVNAPINAINALIDVINAVPGISLGKLQTLSLPRMAQGGLVSSSTIANIGENGREAVLPLDRNTDNWSGLLAHALAEEFEGGNGGGVGGVDVENMNFNINNDMDAEDIGRKIMNSLRRAA